MVLNLEFNYNFLGESLVFVFLEKIIYFGGMIGYNIIMSKKISLKDDLMKIFILEFFELKVFGVFNNRLNVI